MNGETCKTPAICLRIAPWSRTSHIVEWLTPGGRITTCVKGAVRPKSFFLGQYDLNYTCEIVWYLGGGDVHPLRECSPTALREGLRTNLAALIAAEHCRRLAGDLTPNGTDAEAWFAATTGVLDRLAESPRAAVGGEVLDFEMQVLHLSGLTPEIEAAQGAFVLRGERRIAITPAVAKALRNPRAEKNPKILLDAARAIGVFYTFHLDCRPESRRTLIEQVFVNDESQQR